MGNQIRLRTILRWAHILIGLFVGTYVFVPELHADPFWTGITQYGVSAMLISGIWMWQQARISRWLSSN
jgi:high-affinity Fe2+/Pb2+ permease